MFRSKQTKEQDGGPEVVQAYSQLSKQWEVDTITRANKGERRAWLVAGAAVLVAIAEGAAIFRLTPLHRIEPYVVRVNQETGAVDAVSRLNQASRTESEAVNKYMSAKYVRAREEFSRELAPVNYKTVALMSTPPVAQVYHDGFKPENPKSPLRVFAGGGTVTLRILNVSFLGPNIASVRYERTERVDNTVKRALWQATVTFRYSNAPMTEDDRLVNPAGFEVTDYRNDPEVAGG